MEIEQFRWRQSNSAWDKGIEPGALGDKAALVIFFTSRQILENRTHLIDNLKKCYPKAEIVGCSTAGEILGTEVTDDTLIVTAIQFKSTKVKLLTSRVQNAEHSEMLGKELMQKLPQEELKHVFVLSDGLKVDGAKLVKGFKQTLKNNSIGITGGLAADGEKFEKTRVYCNQLLEEGGIVVVGFYGESFNSSYSAITGWRSYGPIRTVTKSDGTRLFELDNKPALELYKNFLGDFAKDLPAIGLVYPLRIWGEGIKKEANLARTILGVDEKTQSILCAGGIPKGCNVQFMMTNTNELVNAASESANNLRVPLKNIHPELCLLMTCVSRKAIMKQRVEEELEAVSEIIGEKTAYTGFYTYGEISPYKDGEECELQNETMAVTTIWEE